MTSTTTSVPDIPPPTVPPTRHGVLVVNLGTPDAPRTPEVRRYLREFLSDPRVIDIRPWMRALLLNLVILPFRPSKSAEAYQKIWSPEGSPLLVYGNALVHALGELLGDPIPVVLAMRYGRPSIAAGLRDLQEQGVGRVIVLPLYPQHASASTGSTLEKVYREAAARWNVPDIVTVPAFFDHPGFIRSVAAVGRPVLEEFKPDHVVMSYHGLPERQVLKSDTSGSHCLRSESCCQTMNAGNRNCYRAQCYITSQLLAAELGLGQDQVSTAFQSRLGRTPWIKPYFDVLLDELPKRGVRRVAVFSPSFVADCLETLEEIGIRGREQFVEAGEDLRLVPSLNAHLQWVETVYQLVKETIS